MQVFLFLSGIMLLILTSATSSKGQNMKVRISAIGDTIIFKFIRPHDNSRLDGYILGYGSSMFSKQLIHLPGDGEPYETEIDAEPKYLIAVQSLNPDKPKKKCAGKVDLQKPLNVVIGSVTESSVLLSWGTLLTSPFMDSNVDDCSDDGQFTVRYREKEPSNTWNYQTCPTTSTVIDNLKRDAQYEFEVRADTETTSGVWSPPVIHNTADEIINEPFKELNQAKPKPVLAVLKNITQAKPAPFLAHTFLPELQTTTEAEEITTTPIFLDDLPSSTQTPEFPHTSINPSTPKITSTVEHTELTSQPSTTPDQPITITLQALTTEHQPTTTHQPSTTQEQTISTTPEQIIITTQELTTSTPQEQTTSTTQEQTISTTQEQTTSTTQEQTTSTTQEQTTSTTQKQTTSTTQEQTTTTQVLTKEQQYTTRQQMITAQQQFIVTTSDPIPTQTNPPPTKPPHTQQHTTSKFPLRTVRPSPPKEPDTITQDKRNTGEIPPKLHRLRPILHPRGRGIFHNTSSLPRPLPRNMTHRLRPNGRVSPNLPINVQRNFTNNRKRVPSGEHHIGLWGPKHDKVPRKNKVKNTNQVPESTIKDVIDLKQIDPLPLKPLAPPTTEKPTYQETTQPPHYFNGSRFDTGDNSSVFSPLPVSEIDAMGKKRFTAPHVIYKTDKRPEEPCSVTNSLSHFPEEEVGYINVTGPPKTPISNLTVVTVEGCASFVIIDWEKTDNETTEYEVESTTKGPHGKEVSIVTTNQTHTAVENLKPESNYEFKVTPKNELGTGPTSDPVTFSTESADPRVSEIPTGKTAIWSSFPFKGDSYTECNGRQYIKRTWYRKFVGIQLCNSLRYKIYLSDSLKGKFYSIGDEAGLGEDHCQFVDSYLDGRTGGPLSPNQLPPRQGYFRAVRQEPVRFGEIGGNSLINYVAWYECGIPIPGKW